MANRQDSGSSSADQHQRPNAQNDGSIPEMGEDVRSQVDDTEDDDEFEDTDDLEDEDDEEEGV